MRITFIGGGNMASALIGGLIARGHQAGQLAVIERDATQRTQLEQQFDLAGVHATIDAAAAAGALRVDVLVLAVKPQQTHEVAASVATHVSGARAAGERTTSGQAPLVLSIAAGIRIGDLSRWLGARTRIVRSMPNTPALIGAGITALAGSAGLEPDDRTRAEAIMSACGQTLWVTDESQLDAVTAVSGSGPAYVFYFMEAMQTAACELGLDAQQARQLTLATFAGAAQLAAQSADPPSVLRERVTSKGGTTAAALAHMQAHDLGGIFAAAIRAAQRRSVELGDELGSA